MFDLRAKVRRLASTQGLDLIIIDYLQLMTVGGSKTQGNREQEISTISRSLKSIAKELNVPVIALSQLSRAVETRSTSKRPQLSDLRESGAIEQDADIVSFIYRPQYYGIEEWEDGDPSENQAEIIIAKHRNGSLEDVRLRFIGELAKFADLDQGSTMMMESKMNEGGGEATVEDLAPLTTDTIIFLHQVLTEAMYRSKIAIFTLFFSLFFSASKGQMLIPMDYEGQSDHLKAYGLVYEAIASGYDCHWLLNYRGGSFAILDGDQNIIEKPCVKGISYENSSAQTLLNLMAELKSPSTNTNSIELERVPRIAVYSPAGKQPWDDAVTLVLTYAEIPFVTIYDEEILTGQLKEYEWLHLHHEDFTGQYGKFYGAYRDAAWYINQKAQFEADARALGYSKVSQVKGAVAKTISSYVNNGGFLFAMCSATDSYDIALAAEGVDICESMFDGDPSAPGAALQLDHSKCFAFENFRLETNPYDTSIHPLISLKNGYVS